MVNNEGHPAVRPFPVSFAQLTATQTLNQSGQSLNRPLGSAVSDLSKLKMSKGANMFGRRFTFVCFAIVCSGLILASGATPQSGKSEPATDAPPQPARGLEDSLKYAEESL